MPQVHKKAVQYSKMEIQTPNGHEIHKIGHSKAFKNVQKCGTFYEGVNIPPREQSSPLGAAKLTPRGKLTLWGQPLLLKTGLWFLHTYVHTLTK
jgi:hypothetical protein